MKSLVLINVLLLTGMMVYAQQPPDIDSLKRELAAAKEDTNRVNLYSDVSRYYSYKYPDTVLHYAYKGLELARKLNFKKGEVYILTWIGEAYNTKGYYPKALEVKLQALQKAEHLNDPNLISSCYNYLGALYIKTEDYQRSIFYYNKATENQVYFNEYKKYLFNGIGQSYFYLNKIDSAYFYIKQTYEWDLQDKTHWSLPYYFMAAISYEKDNIVQALDLYRAGNKVVPPGALDILRGYSGMAKVFVKMNQQDSAIYYAKKTVEEGVKRSSFTVVIDAGSLLTNIYKSIHDLDSAFKYQEIMLAAKDSLFREDKVKLVLNLSFNEQQRQQQIEEVKKEALQQYEIKVKLYSLLAGLAVLLLIAFILYRNNLHKQQTNKLLKQQKEKIQVQRDNLEQTLIELKSTQSQLIQSEKMASLGQLTAGIAHEIQNPLNFVNNFSEINTELIEELEQEVDNGNIEEVKAIARDIKDNEQKIIHHGKRADSIVKGMLQHSRANTGKKELTDINALVDETLRLSYHGMRAKDKEFNATIGTDFNENIGKINIVPQDISRVLLNLFNNAFYAVHEKKAKLNGTFEPTVSVCTKKVNDKLEIQIRDNGNGIPQNIINKIFQPFFTTKPSGQGTGLGLSLSYDIIKAQGGEIDVKSNEGEGAKFTIQLPF